MNKKIEIKILAVSGQSLLTKFMQAADVFEDSKVLGTPKILIVKYKAGEKISTKRAADLINFIKQSLEKNEEIVSFIHILEIQEGKKIRKNKGELAPFVNKDVRCISDGKKWGLLSKYIELNTNLKVITDENMFITSVGFHLNDLKLETSKIYSEDLTKNKFYINK